MDYQEANHHREIAADEEDMDYYCRQFTDFMQT